MEVKMINTLNDFISEFQKIRDLGWIKTHRQGSTGIGKTLEDLLGIPENNIGEPDFGDYELKSVRTNAKSMLTIFTKSPEPKRSNEVLRRKYGYESSKIYGNDKKVLHSTLSADKFISVHSVNRLKIHCSDDRISIESQDGIELIYWLKSTLQDCFNRKYRGKFTYTYADTKGRGASEHFRFVSAFVVSGFSYDDFAALLELGKIKVDLRIGQYPDGRTHDHGTGFRISKRDEVLLFKYREKIV